MQMKNFFYLNCCHTKLADRAIPAGFKRIPVPWPTLTANSANHLPVRDHPPPALSAPLAVTNCSVI